MARISLRPTGSPLVASESTETNRERMAALDAVLEQRRAQVAQGWGPKYHERVNARGKLTAQQRIAALCDDGTAGFRSLGTFVNWDETFGGDEAKTSPAAGVITGFARVHGRWVVVVANDNTVASGAWWPRTPEKIIRAQEMALKLRIPIVYLVDCSGLFLPEQARAFPGQKGAGHIFAMNARLSDAGVPQIAGVMGDCIAGGGYMPIISDRVIMTEQAYMVIAGAALIQGAKSQNLSSIDIGGADVHVHISACADDRAVDDLMCIEMIRGEVARTASSAVAYYRREAEPAPPVLDAAELDSILPVRASEPYDVREIIARLVDDGLFHEVMSHTGHEVLTGLARISGLWVGICANYQGLYDHPHEPGRKRAGGILYREGVARLSAFSRACNDDGIPIVWLQDISGFDIGAEAEKQGLLGYGSSLIHANSNNSTPMFTVLLRKASGAGYYAMAGLPYDPVVQLSTPLTRLAVMEGRTLAIGAFRTRLDDNFRIVAASEDERSKIEAGMRAVEQRIEADMDPYASARQLDTDEIVRVSELRGYLETLVEAAYQAQGVRRIKNPRIWSMHDLDILFSARDDG